MERKTELWRWKRGRGKVEGSKTQRIRGFKHGSEAKQDSSSTHPGLMLAGLQSIMLHPSRGHYRR